MLASGWFQSISGSDHILSLNLSILPTALNEHGESRLQYNCTRVRVQVRVLRKQMYLSTRTITLQCTGVRIRLH